MTTKTQREQAQYRVRRRHRSGATLKQWGLAHWGNKGAADTVVRDRLLDTPTAEAPWLRLGTFDSACRRSDHALDAVIAALNARAAALGCATAPSTDQVAAAQTEGWIALPTGNLADLVRERRS